MDPREQEDEKRARKEAEKKEKLAKKEAKKAEKEAKKREKKLGKSASAVSGGSSPAPVASGSSNGNHVQQAVGGGSYAAVHGEFSKASSRASSGGPLRRSSTSSALSSARGGSSFRQAALDAQSASSSSSSNLSDASRPRRSSIASSVSQGLKGLMRWKKPNIKKRINDDGIAQDSLKAEIGSVNQAIHDLYADLRGEDVGNSTAKNILMLIYLKVIHIRNQIFENDLLHMNYQDSSAALISIRNFMQELEVKFEEHRMPASDMARRLVMQPVRSYESEDALQEIQNLARENLLSKLGTVWPISFVEGGATVPRRNELETEMNTLGEAILASSDRREAINTARAILVSARLAIDRNSDLSDDQKATQREEKTREIEDENNKEKAVRALFGKYRHAVFQHTDLNIELAISEATQALRVGESGIEVLKRFRLNALKFFQSISVLTGGGAEEAYLAIRTNQTQSTEYMSMGEYKSSLIEKYKQLKILFRAVDLHLALANLGNVASDVASVQHEKYMRVRDCAIACLHHDPLDNDNGNFAYLMSVVHQMNSKMTVLKEANQDIKDQYSVKDTVAIFFRKIERESLDELYVKIDDMVREKKANPNGDAPVFMLDGGKLKGELLSCGNNYLVKLTYDDGEGDATFAMLKVMDIPKDKILHYLANLDYIVYSELERHFIDSDFVERMVTVPGDAANAVRYLDVSRYCVNQSIDKWAAIQIAAGGGSDAFVDSVIRYAQATISMLCDYNEVSFIYPDIKTGNYMLDNDVVMTVRISDKKSYQIEANTIYIDTYGFDWTKGFLPPEWQEVSKSRLINVDTFKMVQSYLVGFALYEIMTNGDASKRMGNGFSDYALHTFNFDLPVFNGEKGRLLKPILQALLASDHRARMSLDDARERISGIVSLHPAASAAAGIRLGG